jgi:hypothetical protein
MKNDQFDKYAEQQLFNQPLQLRAVEKQDELTLLQERWSGLIRQHGWKIVADANANNMTKPDLFDIANEIDAFFTALKLKK